jgi:hypothetical protein
MVDAMSDAPPQRFVFISHSGEDTWVARQIAREIGACGARPFLAEAEIDVGADFEDDILTALERTDELVVLLTPWALNRPYVLAEVFGAWGRRIPIVGLLLGLSVAELEARRDIPFFLMRRTVLPLNNISVYLDQLRGRVQAGADPEKRQ